MFVGGGEEINDVLYVRCGKHNHLGPKKVSGDVPPSRTL